MFEKLFSDTLNCTRFERCPDEQHGGLGGDSLLASCEAKAFRGGGFYGYAVKCNPEGFGKVRPHLQDVGGESGTLRDHGAIEVAAGVTVILDESFHLAEQNEAVRALVTRVGVWKVLAEVSEREGTEQGVHHGMGEDVGVRVAVQSTVMGNLNSAEDELAACDEGVNVESTSDSERHQQKQMRVREQSELD